MSVLELISVAISIIPGPGITRLLTSFTGLIRARRRVTVHWVPLVWAFAILLIQFQYWWGFFGINTGDRVWSNLDLLVWVGATLAIVIAGDLVLPASYDAERLDLFDAFLAEG
jgi:hypothetical protein